MSILDTECSLSLNNDIKIFLYLNSIIQFFRGFEIKTFSTVDVISEM